MNRHTGKDMQAFLGCRNPGGHGDRPMTEEDLATELAIVKTAEQCAYERGRTAALTAPEILWELEAKSKGLEAVVRLLGPARAKEIYTQGVMGVRTPREVRRD